MAPGVQWVEGLTLNQFVGRYADKPASLESLLQIWLRMSKKLRAAEVGQCDLQPGNVLSRSRPHRIPTRKSLSSTFGTTRPRIPAETVLPSANNFV